MEIRELGTGDQDRILGASHLFDQPPTPAAAATFLQAEGHHLIVAYEDGRPVGFITGVEMTHPDKGTEMFIYELGVEEAYRRRGIGRALVDRLGGLGRDRGCYGMWVLTDEQNTAARATYEGTGGTPESGQVVVTWNFAP